MVSSSMMPHLFPFASSSHAPEQDMHDSTSHSFQQQQPPRKRSASVLRRFHRIGDWLRRDEEERSRSCDKSHQQEQKQALEEEQQSIQRAKSEDEQSIQHATSEDEQQIQHYKSEDEQQVQHQKSEDELLAKDHDALPMRRPSMLGRSFSKSKRAIPELPRQFTFKRQNSEKREHLMPVEPSITERRAVSADRRPRTMSNRRLHSPPLTPLPSRSAPDVITPDRLESSSTNDPAECYFDPGTANFPQDLSDRGFLPELPPFQPLVHDDDEPEYVDDRELQAELEAKWILNLSMHFRDKSDREKFFVTYAQEPNRWRRLTVSCDYRDAPLDSLEADLKSLRYQRDKSQRIYEAIRESLLDIQFYDTVTNLKLETEDGRLHVHVTEDVNEIVPYPSTSLVQHIECDRYRESDLDFQSHLSGFVYKVSADDRIFIKKEIPGPDTVDEFMYEINALDSLRGSKSVIKFHGLVVDEEDKLVKGLLISFASFGALVDIIYDYKSTDSLSWCRREKWAYQIIQGLSEIHEAGFVQGDFTLSNIVIDSEDDAKIIDINRRGCPIGWEPPELIRLIRSGQRISMCIGVKSDIFQLGMVLWALAENQDEPEHVERTDSGMPRVTAPDVPEWFKNAIDQCLSENPRDRPSAKELLSVLSDHVDHGNMQNVMEASEHSFADHRPPKEDVDPSTVVNRDDIDEFKRRRDNLNATPRSHPATDHFHSADPATSTGYRIEDDSNGSYVLPRRGRSPYNYHRSFDGRSVSSTTSISLSQGGPRWEHICPEEMPDFEDEAFPTYHDPDVGQRPSMPDIPPFLPHAPEYFQEEASGASEYARHHDSDIEHEGRRPSRHQRVLFSPPAHQDSGFDDYMAESLEHEQVLPQPQQLSNLAPLNLPPLLTASMAASNNESQRVSSLTQQSESLMSPIGLTHSRDSHTPQSPPTPATPFSYHTPLSSPLNLSYGRRQNTHEYSDKMHHDTERPDSKYCPDPTDRDMNPRS